MFHVFEHRCCWTSKKSYPDFENISTQASFPVCFFLLCWRKPSEIPRCDINAVIVVNFATCRLHKGRRQGLGSLEIEHQTKGRVCVVTDVHLSFTISDDFLETRVIARHLSFCHKYKLCHVNTYDVLTWLPPTAPCQKIEHFYMFSASMSFRFMRENSGLFKSKCREG